MAKILNKLFDDMDELKDKVTVEADEILKVLDVDKILDNPKQYLTSIAGQFVDSFEDEMEKAKTMGQNYAKAVINNVETNKGKTTVES